MGSALVLLSASASNTYFLKIRKNMPWSLNAMNFPVHYSGAGPMLTGGWQDNSECQTELMARDVRFMFRAPDQIVSWVSSQSSRTDTEV